MIFLAVFLGSLVFGWVLASLLSLRPCGERLGTLAECRALVHGRGHGWRQHVWEWDKQPIALRAYDEESDRLYRRNLAAVMAETRIGLSVMNPKAFVLGSYG